MWRIRVFGFNADGILPQLTGQGHLLEESAGGLHPQKSREILFRDFVQYWRSRKQHQHVTNEMYYISVKNPVCLSLCILGIASDDIIEIRGHGGTGIMSMMKLNHVRLREMTGLSM